MDKCIGGRTHDRDINPRSISKIRKGGYFVPDCPDYESRISLPPRVRLEDVLAGWHCLNCRNMKS